MLYVLLWLKAPAQRLNSKLNTHSFFLLCWVLSTPLYYTLECSKSHSFWHVYVCQFLRSWRTWAKTLEHCRLITVGRGRTEEWSESASWPAERRQLQMESEWKQIGERLVRLFIHLRELVMCNAGMGAWLHDWLLSGFDRIIITLSFICVSFQ